MLSYPVAQEITRRSGSNLALAFSGLPAERRAAMDVLYAFCRVVDDIADEPGRTEEQRLAELAAWDAEVRACYGGAPATPLGRELADVVGRYPVPGDALMELIEGMRRDVRGGRFRTWEELRLYCWRVASCVGFASQAVFGADDPGSRAYAEALGLALQTTNILRDVRADFALGRVYLPDEDFHRAGVDPDTWRGGNDPGSLQVYRLMGERSRHWFAAAERLLPEADRERFVAAEGMRRVYQGILRKIEAAGHDVWSGRPRLSRWRKAWLLKAGGGRRAGTAPRRVVVLGGGFAGLSAAVHAARAGHAVTLFEARATLGGRTHSFRDPVTGDVIDNGQHILMGCYHETLAFLESLGVGHRLERQARLNVPFLREGGRRVALEAGVFGRASALLGFGLLSMRERIRLMRVALAARRAGRGAAGTAAEWLRRQGQTERAVRVLWEPFCLAALNEPVATADAGLFAEVVRRALASREGDATIILSRAGLSDLFVAEARNTIEAAGGRVVTGTAAEALGWEGNRVTGVVVDRERVAADAVISAVPWHALRRLVPAESDLGRRVGRLRGAPIVSVALWFDRPVMTEPFAGFVESPVHWVFDASRLHRDGVWSRVNLTISAADAWAGLSSDDIVARALAECRKHLPAADGAQVRHAFVHKARDATVRAVPEFASLRPGVASGWEGLLLAGDWTDTGLPSTIEGAVLSGRRAAEAVG